MDSLFGELERFGSEVIYPYRWALLVAAIVVVGALGVVAYRRRWYVTVWEHRMLTAGIALPALLVAIPAGWYALSPLWERSLLEEAAPEFDRDALSGAGIATPTPTVVPAATPTSDGGASPTPPEMSTPTPTSTNGGEPPSPAEPEARLVSFGEWQGADDFHFAEGQALLIETASGEYVLRVENFSVRNGPDLFVYLSPSEDGFTDSAINLGELKATDGAFNYDVPVGIDIDQFKSAIVWCRQFSVLFGSATLIPTNP